MADDDAIGRERLDCRQRFRAKQPLKSGQLALALKHKPHNRALRFDLVGPQHPNGP
jgi:hypothetical protein